MNIASYIDHTVLKPTTTLADIQKVCNEATTYQFAAVCIPPYFLKEANVLVQNSGVKLATVIGFPFGYNHYLAKAAEVKQAIKDKANDVDIVMNIAAFRQKDYDYLSEEIRELVAIAKKENITLKLIVESGILSNEELIECCCLYKNSGIDFMKTSTGYAERGATLEAVQIMRAHLPATIQIKASGGIKDFGFAKQLVEAGATRLGCSASVAIVEGQPAGADGY
jgi:deoxyribose-phosphate aldolase